MSTYMDENIKSCMIFSKEEFNSLIKNNDKNASPRDYISKFLNKKVESIKHTTDGYVIVFISNQHNEIIVDLKNGTTIKASPTTNPDYPGIDVEVISNAYDMSKSSPRVLIEKNKGLINALIWNDTNEEDYTKKHILCTDGSLQCDTCKRTMNYVIWCDVALINKKYYYREAPILIDPDNEGPEDTHPYLLDNYITALENEFGVSSDDIETVMIDGIDLPVSVIKELNVGLEDLGGRCPYCKSF